MFRSALRERQPGGRLTLGISLGSVRCLPRKCLVRLSFEGEIVMATNGKATTNDIFRLYARKDAKVTLRKLDKETVLVEADANGFEFLGKLLLTLARSREHSVQISPNGAGQNRFAKGSTLWLYLPRLPCPDAKSSKRRRGMKKVRPPRRSVRPD
jgi:hypothetical protein